MLQYLVPLGSSLTPLVQPGPTSGQGILLYNSAPLFFADVIDGGRERRRQRAAVAESDEQRVKEACCSVSGRVFKMSVGVGSSPCSELWGQKSEVRGFEKYFKFGMRY